MPKENYFRVGREGLVCPKYLKNRLCTRNGQAPQYDTRGRTPCPPKLCEAPQLAQRLAALAARTRRPGLRSCLRSPPISVALQCLWLAYDPGVVLHEENSRVRVDSPDLGLG